MDFVLGKSLPREEVEFASNCSISSPVFNSHPNSELSIWILKLVLEDKALQFSVPNNIES